MFQVISGFIVCKLKHSSFMALLLCSGGMEDSSNASCQVLIFFISWNMILLFHKKLDKWALGNSQIHFFSSEIKITTSLFFFFLRQSTVNHSHPICSVSFFNMTPSFYKLCKTDLSVEVQNNRNAFYGIHPVGWRKQPNVGLGPPCK